MGISNLTLSGFLYMKMSQIEMTFTLCLKIFCQEFLLKFAPIVGFGRYRWPQTLGCPYIPKTCRYRWPQTQNNSGIYSITSTHDQCLAAFSRWAIVTNIKHETIFKGTRCNSSAIDTNVKHETVFKGMLCNSSCLLLKATWTTCLRGIKASCLSL